MGTKELLEMKTVKVVGAILYLFFCFSFANAQKDKKVEFCFCETHHLNGKKYSPKQQVMDLLKEYDSFHTCDKRNKIRFIDQDTIYVDQKALNLPDSVNEDFIITSIKTKKDNYIIRNNRLFQKHIYLIDLMCQNTQNCPEHIRIISVENSNPCKGNQIKVGDHIKMTIFPFFEKNEFLFEDDGDIIHGIPSLHGQTCFLFENIWVVGFPFSYRNYFETPNLQGLYYIPPES
jgi:hypothetical protein